jgi:hypothetical protein
MSPRIASVAPPPDPTEERDRTQSRRGEPRRARVSAVREAGGHERDG